MAVRTDGAFGGAWLGAASGTVPIATSDDEYPGGTSARNRVLWATWSLRSGRAHRMSTFARGSAHAHGERRTLQMRVLLNLPAMVPSTRSLEVSLPLQT